ncbi:hypothetical protein CEQ20_11655 [Yersinia pseudotuberculosis]|nr:hypothetical protein CEQ20_11655 [Yersinia pseudotuberculosis]AYX09684.1 hypothetical protein EGX52_01775 [Yersinia pseudotuberculosis]PEI13588.1 hypothetical protein CRM78_10180 [Yersinia pseudotuberculosis]
MFIFLIYLLNKNAVITFIPIILQATCALATLNDFNYLLVFDLKINRPIKVFSLAAFLKLEFLEYIHGVYILKILNE